MVLLEPLLVWMFLSQEIWDIVISTSHNIIHINIIHPWNWISCKSRKVDLSIQYIYHTAHHHHVHFEGLLEVSFDQMLRHNMTVNILLPTRTFYFLQLLPSLNSAFSWYGKKTNKFASSLFSITKLSVCLLVLRLKTVC